MADIHFAEGFTEALMNAVSDGVTVIDRDLRIVYQNATIRRQFGSRLEEQCFAAYRGRTEPCEDCLILDVLQDGKARSGVRDIRLPDGNVLIVEFSSSPIADAQGNIIGAVEAVRDVTKHVRLTYEYGALRREMVRRAQFGNIITQSKKMKAVFRLIERVAATTSSVIISGESGTGKELVARAIFANSNRSDKPFVSLNCGAIPENLLESELFGHARGAFTGAVRDHIGLIETADQGTLFLDEVAELPPPLQVKLLRFLQEGEARRVGDTHLRKFNVRIIAATNRNLEQAVRDGAFREDLYFRMNVIPVLLPPLRERPEDVPLLANHFLQRLCDEHGREVSGISSQALKMLWEYPWPGNVRELENAIEYAIHLTEDGQPIMPAQLPSKIAGKQDTAEDLMLPLSLEGYTKHMILYLQADHTEEEIAGILGISRKSLWERRKRLGLLRPNLSRRPSPS
jgi:two-component system, NtrC family, response regulator HydG